MIPHIKARGTHQEIGEQIGSAIEPLIKRSLLMYKKYFEKMTDCSYADGLKISKKHWSAAEQHTPQSWAMMQGLASGSHSNFEDIFLLNALEEVEFSLEHRVEKCTSLVAKSEAGIFLAHNEDWYKFDAANFYVAKITYPSGVTSIGPNYSCLLPVRGINSAGLAISDDTVTASDEKIGIPRVCLMRNALEARTISEAVEIVSHQERAGGYHYYFAQGDKIVSLETSGAREIEILPIKEKNREYAIHNNCFLNPELNALDPSKKSEIREEQAIQKQGEKLLNKAKNLDIAGIQKILKFHPGICNHRRELYRSETINSFIADLESKAIWIGQGRACQADYQKFTF